MASMVKKLLLLGLLVLLFGCVGQGLEHSFSDKRFDANVDASNGKITITFTKAPFGAYVSEISIEKEVGGDVGYQYYMDCSDSFPVTVNKPVTLNCYPSEPGTYLLRFKISHSHGASYKPVKGEMCLKYSDGSWECESRAHIGFVVK